MGVLFFIPLVLLSSCYNKNTRSLALHNETNILTYVENYFGTKGYIDINGKWVIKHPRYQARYQFSEGCAAVCTSYTTNKCWGYIDR
jgi:hypothetical protein